jgi:NADH-quinone oxidoreductase subunit H
MIKLTKYIMLFVLPSLLVALLMGGFRLDGINILWSILKVVGIVLLLTLIKNTNPRIRIRQAVNFFMIWMNLLAVIALVLIVFGY